MQTRYDVDLMMPFDGVALMTFTVDMIWCWLCVVLLWCRPDVMLSWCWPNVLLFDVDLWSWLDAILTVMVTVVLTDVMWTSCDVDRMMLTQCTVDLIWCWPSVTLTLYNVDPVWCWPSVMLTWCHVDWFMLTQCDVDQVTLTQCDVDPVWHWPSVTLSVMLT